MIKENASLVNRNRKSGREASARGFQKRSRHPLVLGGCVRYCVSLCTISAVRGSGQVFRRIEAEFLDEIQIKVLEFPPCYSQSPLQLCLRFTQPLTVSVKEKGGKPYRKPYPLLHGLRNPYRNLKSELPRLCPETSTWLEVHEFGFCTRWFTELLSI